MERLKYLGEKPSKSGKTVSGWSLFLCPHCNKEVERWDSAGKEAKSCGCAWELCHKSRIKEERKEDHPLYQVWSAMKYRCHTPGHKDAPRYGERGIYVCNEWRNSFDVFRIWAEANGYEKGLELDREKNDGPYTPDNCRFVTHAVNCQNRSDGKLTMDDAIEIRQRYAQGGITQTSLGKDYGVGHGIIGSIVRNESWI